MASVVPAVPKVVVLCGGLGVIREETDIRPKPMAEVGGRPLLWHLMRLYASHGLREFVLCLGERGDAIRQYFADYRLHGSDVTFELATGDVEYGAARLDDWRVTLVDTGEETQSGARIKRVERYLAEDELFLCTYGDRVADVNLTALLEYHRSRGKVATVTGVRPIANPGLVTIDGVDIPRYAEQREREQLVDGGFFVFDRSFLERLSGRKSLVLEEGPLEALAAEGELAIYEHDGFWESADSLREVEHLRALWASGRAPWRVWDDRRGSAARPGGKRRTDVLRAADRDRG